MSQEPRGETTRTDHSGGCQNKFFEGGLNTEDPISWTPVGNQLKLTQCKTTPEGGQRPARKNTRGGEGQGWTAAARLAYPLPLPTLTGILSTAIHHIHHSEVNGGKPSSQGKPSSRAETHAGGARYVLPPTLPAMNPQGGPRTRDVSDGRGVGIVYSRTHGRLGPYAQLTWELVVFTSEP